MARCRRGSGEEDSESPGVPALSVPTLMAAIASRRHPKNYGPQIRGIGLSDVVVVGTLH